MTTTIKAGEIYGKQHGNKLLMYNVLKVTKKGITLQNVDNPLSLFETTAEKLASSGYICISQTPFVDTQAKGKKRKLVRKAHRCPFTTDIFEGRADCEKPQAPSPTLFLEAV
jgi:hypothetical protein